MGERTVITGFRRQSRAVHGPEAAIPRSAATTMRSGVLAPTTTRRCFEALTPGCVPRPGLSWYGRVSARRDGFRGAFHEFDVAPGRSDDRAGHRQVCCRTPRSSVNPRQDPGRTVQNASCDEVRVAEPCGRSARSYERTRKRAATVPGPTCPPRQPRAEKFAKQLKVTGIPVRRTHERLRRSCRTSVWSTTTSHGCFRATVAGAYGTINASSFT